MEVTVVCLNEKMITVRTSLIEMEQRQHTLVVNKIKLAGSK